MHKQNIYIVPSIGFFRPTVQTGLFSSENLIFARRLETE